MSKFLIVKTGGTLEDFAASHGDFEDWTALGMGLEPGQWEVVHVQAGASLPDPAQYAGCVITGSHDMVTDRTGWMLDTEAWIRRAAGAGLPMLGICFGHQILASALGGEAGFHPNGLEMGTVDITVTEAGREDVLFAPLAPSFKGNMAHSQTVLRLPDNGVLLATGGHEPHQSFRVGEHVWGVQFHPEFNAEVIRRYREDQREKAVAEGRDPDALRIEATDTPDSASLLKRFADYCRSRA